METPKDLSIIIPAYNEKDTINQTISDLKNYLEPKNINSEIIVVDDGSTDGTKEIIDKIEGIKVIHHTYNKGYGAAVKTAAKSAQAEWILTFDADGQHKIDYIEKLFTAKDGFEMVVGARQGYKGPLIRQPAKLIIHWIAEYLIEKKIPDLNSGLRLIEKKYFIKYSHLLPNAFSWTTTLTLAFFKEGLNIKYVPIEINKRQGGKSSVKPNDALKTMMLVLRIIMLFSPLRIFLPVSLGLFIIGFIFLIIDLILLNISEGTIFILITSILIFFFGLIADQIAAIRREIHN